MAPPLRFQADLSVPADLQRAIADYLSLGVCPVADDRPPGPMTEVRIELHLPGGQRWEGEGRAIAQAGPGRFLVQLKVRPDLEWLRQLASPAPAPPPARPGPPSEAASAPELFEEEEPSPPGNRSREVSGSEGDHSAVYARIGALPLFEKQRLARYGNKTVRGLLVRDPSKGLHVLVVKNPKLTLDEALDYSNRPSLAADALRELSRHTTFASSRQLLFNLVRNPSTPVDVALQLLPRLGPSEWRVVTNLNNMRTPIAAAARKLLLKR